MKSYTASNVIIIKRSYCAEINNHQHHSEVDLSVFSADFCIHIRHHRHKYPVFETFWIKKVLERKPVTKKRGRIDELEYSHGRAKQRELS